ncbi:PAS domain-containing protein [Heliobacterium gestii]|uniref:histidine kinase n=1 Tax=Heliomicrobium gestii TaxID=2699 RepID=A0A845LEJ2_HELGE|nr:PAS domain-containing sensor histidine kinase [Heliomicrobium gestii]MBM7867470.1 PAS domain S-box-containing protein [Heliomicrobium gestii]MZP43981.1 PAS domain-containing protein [Heliomicrobium gestii]
MVKKRRIKHRLPSPLRQGQIDAFEMSTNFFSLSTDMFLIVNRDGSIIGDNGKLRLYLGVPEDTVSLNTTASLIPFIHPNYREKAIQSFCHAFQEGAKQNMEVRYTCADGADRWISWSLSPQLDRGFMYCVGRDITEKKRMERELEKSNENLSNLLGSITDVCFAIDSECRFTYLNDEAEKAFGHRRAELLGKNIWSLYPHIQDTIFHREYGRAIAERRQVSFEAYSPFFERWSGIRVYPTRDGVLIYSRDISEQKKLLNEIDRLERLNLIGQMAGGIGHEIRNPMTTVRGFLQVLSTKHRESEVHFDLMIEELDRANGIITDFLSLSKTKPANRQPHNLNRLLENIVPSIQANAYESKKEVLLELNPLPDVLIDKKEICRVLLNLMQNALDVTTAGGTIHVRTDHREPRHVTVSIRDNGPGIAPENIGRIGTPFFTTKADGTGLGLALSYNTINRHGGKIEFDTCAQGTTFYVHLPLA